TGWRPARSDPAGPCGSVRRTGVRRWRLERIFEPCRLLQGSREERDRGDDVRLGAGVPRHPRPVDAVGNRAASWIEHGRASGVPPVEPRTGLGRDRAPTLVTGRGLETVE